mmetsp:Transcript_14021/g.31767  ORF Transcript_14021/g.31767 Transcript_14021/m.31767 type:complete len:298 (+) Transcript_14021:150-1043(+)
MHPDPRHGGGPQLGELGKMMPVTGVLFVVVVLYTQYVFLHGWRLLQFDLPDSSRQQDLVVQGYQQLGLFHIVTTLLLYSLARCILTHPGHIPDGIGWELKAEPEEDTGGGLKELRSGFSERKQTTGERRHCKWCLKYKPDRCHHCRICCLCILKMDHHCPMVYNCIGFCNHKYFFLLLVYATIDLSLISLTLWESVLRAIHWDLSLEMMLALAGAEALAMSLLAAIAYFLSFHVWLVSQGLTTLEYVERKGNKPNWRQKYDLGLYQNICNVLGPNPLLWLLPLSHPTGDGVIWATAE